MIARIWHGMTPLEKADEYEEFLYRTGLADYTATPGNLGAYLLKRREGDRVHFLTLTFWQSEEAIQKFAGEDIEKARYYPEDPEFLIEMEPFVTHYDVAMSSTSGGPREAAPVEEAEVRALYWHLLDAWNQRKSGDFAGLFTLNGNMIGFDGSLVDGRSEIKAHIHQVFHDHLTAEYVGKIREVRFLTPDSALLRAVAGMMPPGKRELNPALNVVQTLVARRSGGEWRIELFQSTPAQFHGRPEAAQQLTEELSNQLTGWRFDPGRSLSANE